MSKTTDKSRYEIEEFSETAIAIILPLVRGIQETCNNPSYITSNGEIYKRRHTVWGDHVWCQTGGYAKGYIDQMALHKAAKSKAYSSFIMGDFKQETTSKTSDSMVRKIKY